MKDRKEQQRTAVKKAELLVANACMCRSVLLLSLGREDPYALRGPSHAFIGSGLKKDYERHPAETLYHIAIVSKCCILAAALIFP